MSRKKSVFFIIYREKNTNAVKKYREQYILHGCTVLIGINIALVVKTFSVRGRTYICNVKFGVLKTSVNTE